MAVRLLALDLDGTTFCEGTSIGETNLAALHAAREKGVIVVFITGRRKLSPIRHVFQHADYVIMNNGGTVYLPSGERISHQQFSKEQFAFLLNFCNERHFTMQLFFGDDWWINTREHAGDAMADYYLSLGEVPHYFRELFELPSQQVDGAIISGAAYEQFAKELEIQRQDFYCVKSGEHLLDVIPQEINKWAGLLQLAQDKGIAPKEIIAVGNYYNDVEMISHAGIGVAVANAPDEVKAAADYVTGRTHAEHAVAEVIERFILI